MCNRLKVPFIKNIHDGQPSKMKGGDGNVEMQNIVKFHGSGTTTIGTRSNIHYGGHNIGAPSRRTISRSHIQPRTEITI